MHDNDNDLRNEENNSVDEQTENISETSEDVVVQDTDDTETSTEVDTVSDEEEEEIQPYVPKLTEKQQKIWQTVLGLLSGAAIWLCLGLASMDQDNQLLSWSFVIVFAAVMIIRSQVEKRTGVQLRTFMKWFLIGLIVFLAVFVIYGLATGQFTSNS